MMACSALRYRTPCRVGVVVVGCTLAKSVHVQGGEDWCGQRVVQIGFHAARNL